MATIAQLDSALVLKIAIQTATKPARMASDYLDEYEAIPPGSARYQLRCNAAGQYRPDSNRTYQVAAIDLIVVHNLSDPANERAYTGGNLQTDLALLTSDAFLRSMTTIVFDLIERPTIEISRVGNLIVYHLSARVALIP